MFEQNYRHDLLISKKNNNKNDRKLTNQEWIKGKYGQN